MDRDDILRCDAFQPRDGCAAQDVDENKAYLPPNADKAVSVIKCQVCGVDFPKRMPWARFCSSKCRYNAWPKSRRGSRKPKPRLVDAE